MTYQSTTFHRFLPSVSAAAFGLRLVLVAVSPIATATAVAAAPLATPLQLAQEHEALTGGGLVDPDASTPESSATPWLGDNSGSCRGPVTPAIRPMQWGYYPGYGCGPVPPAQTVYP